jgi:mycoredoxin
MFERIADTPAIQGDLSSMSSSDLPGDRSRPLTESAAAEAASLTDAEEIRMYATVWCGDCRRSKRVFDALGIGYTYVDIDQDEHAAQLVLRLNRGMRSVPTIVFPDGSFLSEPSNVELETKLRALASA